MGSREAPSAAAVAVGESVRPLIEGVVEGGRLRIHRFLPDDFVGVDAEHESVVVLHEDTDRRKSIRRPPTDKLVARSKVVMVSWWLCSLSTWDSLAFW